MIELEDYVGPLVADADGVWVMTTDEGEDPGGQDDVRRLLRVDAATDEITATTPIDGYVDGMGLARMFGLADALGIRPRPREGADERFGLNLPTSRERSCGRRVCVTPPR